MRVDGDRELLLGVAVHELHVRKKMIKQFIMDDFDRPFAKTAISCGLDKHQDEIFNISYLAKGRMG